MPVDLVVPIIAAVSSALDYAHKKGLLHRDVKPANVMVADLDTDDPSVFLADFGIARPLDDTSGITTTNMTVGTVAYAAPEQLMGESMDGRADQYALAATAYHLLTGAQLFPHSNPAVVISKHLNTKAPNLGDCRPDCAHLDDVLQIALDKDPAARFPSCSAFAQALVDESLGQAGASANAMTQAAGQPRSSASTMAARPPKPPAARSRLVWAVVGGFAATILLVGVIGVLWRPWQHPQSNTTVISSSNAPTTSTPTETAAAPPLTPTSAAPQPPPATTVTITTKVVASIIGTSCAGSSGYNIDKLSTDPATDQIVVCEYDESMNNQVWQPVTEPLVGTVESGSPCLPSQKGQSARSTNGYLLSCWDPGTSQGFIWIGSDY
jgi:serine/threonine protein kinase, bacterial